MIAPATILSYHKAGFKLVPMTDDSKKPALAWTEIYEKGWQIEELSHHYDDFKNVATCFGRVWQLQNSALYLNCLDIDSKNVFDALANLQDTESGKNYSLIDEARKRTFVTKTKKTFGFHIFWLSSKQYKPVKTEMCKDGFEYEIKTDKTSGLAHLPPSKHRASEYRYQSIGQPHLMIADHFYASVMLLTKECRLTPRRIRSSYGTFAEDVALLKNSKEPRILSEQAVEQIAALLQPAYRQGKRHLLCFCLAGVLHRANVRQGSAFRVIERLAEGDAERPQRLASVASTYKKPRALVNGSKQLYSALGSNAEARAVINALYKILA